MSKIIKIEVNQATVDYIQSVEYHVISRKSLLMEIGNTLGVDSAVFKDYEKEYLEYDLMFRLIKDEIRNTYIPKKLLDESHAVDWSLDYRTNLLTIIVKCECGIKLVESNDVSFLPDHYCDDIVSKFNKE